MHKRRITSSAAVGILLFLLTAPSQAWTPATVQAIAGEAYVLAPRDLARQIAHHRDVFAAGVAAPLPERDLATPERLAKAVDGEVAAAIQAIQKHKPFPEVVRRLGVVASYLAYANAPLPGWAAGDANVPEGARIGPDYFRYAEAVESRFPLIFYGILPGLEAQKGVGAVVDEALRRGRESVPLLDLEYQRIGFASGLDLFDDRSTAFGVASTSFSHAVTDVSTVLRYIWLKAGGSDDRTHLPARGEELIVLPRSH
jgi:hypothetical protein